MLMNVHWVDSSLIWLWQRSMVQSKWINWTLIHSKIILFFFLKNIPSFDAFLCRRNWLAQVMSSSLASRRSWPVPADWQINQPALHSRKTGCRCPLSATTTPAPPSDKPIDSPSRRAKSCHWQSPSSSIDTSTRFRLLFFPYIFQFSAILFSAPNFTDRWRWS